MHSTPFAGGRGVRQPFICASVIALRIIRSVRKRHTFRPFNAAVQEFFLPRGRRKAVKSRYALLLQNRAFLSEKCRKYTFICRIQSEFFLNTAV